jgi:hypothetical protein
MDNLGSHKGQAVRTAASERPNRPASTAWRITATWFGLGRISMQSKVAPHG